MLSFLNTLGNVVMLCCLNTPVYVVMLCCLNTLVYAVCSEYQNSLLDEYPGISILIPSANGWVAGIRVSRYSITLAVQKGR